MFVYKWEVHWKIGDWDTLARHYGRGIVTIITANYRLTPGHLLGRGFSHQEEMKPDLMHWSAPPPGWLSA